MNPNRPRHALRTLLPLLAASLAFAAADPPASHAARPAARPLPACTKAAGPAKPAVTTRNKHCVARPSPPPGDDRDVGVLEPETPSCDPNVWSVNIYVGPTGSFTCGFVSAGVIRLRGDVSLYPLYRAANVMLFVQLTYASGYYPLDDLPLAVAGDEVVVDVSAELARICGSFPLASRRIMIDAVQLLTSSGYADWFVHVYTPPLVHDCP